MKRGDLIAVLTDNPPHWRKGAEGEIVQREIPTLNYLVDFGEAGQHIVPADQMELVVWKLQVFDDVEIWVCSRDKANELVRADRSQAWRIWLFDEFRQHLLDDNAELLEVIEKKRQKPGPYFKNQGGK